MRGPGVTISELNPAQVSHPGLYACFGSAATWKQLGIGKPPDARPLYVGKAETTLASRDVEGHFGRRERGAQSQTGSSTLRRSLAALLAAERGYRGMPRNSLKPGYFSDYGLSEIMTLTCRPGWKPGFVWLVWPRDVVAELDTIETDVLGKLLPPLNLDKVVTPWRRQVKEARKLLAAEARAWKPT